MGEVALSLAAVTVAAATEYRVLRAVLERLRNRRSFQMGKRVVVRVGTRDVGSAEWCRGREAAYGTSWSSARRRNGRITGNVWSQTHTYYRPKQAQR